MNIRNLNIKDASSDALRALAQDIDVELQERDLAERKHIMDDAITHHLYVGEVEEQYREEYIGYLEEMAGPGESPAAQEILAEWRSQQDIIQSRKTTGA